VTTSNWRGTVIILIYFCAHRFPPALLSYSVM